MKKAIFILISTRLDSSDLSCPLDIGKPGNKPFRKSRPAPASSFAYGAFFAGRRFAAIRPSFTTSTTFVSDRYDSGLASTS